MFNKFNKRRETKCWRKRHAAGVSDGVDQVAGGSDGCAAPAGAFVPEPAHMMIYGYQDGWRGPWPTTGLESFPIATKTA
ncbi:hypothetical protein [Duganella sp. CF517]|uniref:hypothetical protein n=1 Tax=Duganella sp. CF517 TaxID=1881038 RepID=UPI001160C4C7|nr:hypothetical protein [Duganella sp. CF517]